MRFLPALIGVVIGFIIGRILKVLEKKKIRKEYFQEQKGGDNVTQIQVYKEKKD